MENLKVDEMLTGITDWPTKTYDVLYVDPPWPMKKSQRKSRPNQVEMDYPTLSLEDLEIFPVANLANPDSCLFLWTTHRFLPDALRLMSLWDFRYQRTITWDKGNGMCLYGFHHRTEMLLFGYRGHLEVFPERKAFPTLVQAKSDRHSAKPQVFRDLILPFGRTRIELFARELDPNWDSWGNEVGWVTKRDEVGKGAVDGEIVEEP